MKRTEQQEIIVTPPTNITIAAGQSLSGVVDLTQKKPIALIAPPEWDGAPLSFLMSIDGVNFHPVSHWSTDQVFTIPIVPDYWVPLDTQVFPPTGVYLKLHSGHPQDPVAQSADRVFQLVTQ